MGMPEIPVLGILKQDNCKFESSLGCLVRQCLKTKNNNKIRLGMVSRAYNFSIWESSKAGGFQV